MFVAHFVFMFFGFWRSRLVGERLLNYAMMDSATKNPKAVFGIHP
jgi:hypothetical protein